MSLKNLWNKRKDKRVKLGMRIFALVLAIALIVPNSIAWAQESADEADGNNTQITSLGVSGEESSDTEGENGLVIEPATPEQVAAFYTINVESRIISLKDAETLDLMEGVSVTGEDGGDYTEFLRASLPEGYDATKAGEYIITYSLVMDEVEIKSTYATVTITSGHAITAEEMLISIGQYASLEEVDFIQGITAVDADGNDVTNNVVIITKEDNPPINLEVTGTYLVYYAVEIDGQRYAETPRAIKVVQNNVVFHISDITFYLEDYKEKDLDHITENLAENIQAFDLEGNEITEYIAVLDDGGASFDSVGSYPVIYGVVKDGETLATSTRNVIVEYSREGRGRAVFESVVLGGNYPDGDILSAVVLRNGKISVRKWMRIPDEMAASNSIIIGSYGWVGQYFSGSTVPKEAGKPAEVITSATGAADNSLRFFIDGRVYAMNSTKVVVSTLEEALSNEEKQVALRTFSIAQENVQIQEYITLERGGNVLEKEYRILYTGTKASVSVDLRYGGDTYFSGYDSGWTGYSNEEGGAVRSWRGADQGEMKLRGAQGHPMDGYFAGLYSSSDPYIPAHVNYATWMGVANFEATSTSQKPYVNKMVLDDGRWNMLDLNISTHADIWKSISNQYIFKENNSQGVETHFNYHDSAYVGRWIRTATPHVISVIKTEETFGHAGAIQLSAIKEKTGPPTARVSHLFSITNRTDQYTGDTYDVTFTTNSKRGWPVIMDAHYRSIQLAPGETRIIPVDVIIPEMENGIPTAEGATDILTLYAEYWSATGQTTGGKVKADNTTRTVAQIGKPFIIGVDITRLTPTDILDFKVTYINVPTAQQPVNFKAEIQDANFNTMTTVIIPAKDLLPGGEFTNIDISSLPGSAEGIMYRIYVKPDENKIEYAHSSTTFLKGKDTIIGVESLTVSPKDVTLNLNQIYSSLTATINPTNATTTGVFWTSSDDSVASVDIDTGVVTTHKVGTVTITATSLGNVGATDTAIITVSAPVTNVNNNPAILTLKKGDKGLITSTVLPATAGDKTLDWTTNLAGVATVVADPTNQPNSDTQKATVTAVSDGISTISAESTYTRGIFGRTTVRVDGTKPGFSKFLIEKTGNIWNRAVNTNKELKVTLEGTDPTTNGFASGVKEIYYQVVVGKNPAKPGFDLQNPTGWTKVSGTSTSFLLNKTTVGGDGDYKVFAVVVDNVGNFSDVSDGGETINVDTKVPEIGLVQGASKDIHVLTSDVVDLKAGIKATDNNVSVVDQLVITPASVNTATTGKYNINYKYTDPAGNTASFDRVVYVHGRPTVTANDTVNVNQEEGTLQLLNNPDARINLSAPGVKHYPSGTEANINPTVVASGAGVINGNILPVGGKAGMTIPVTYNASYNNTLTTPNVVTAPAKVVNVVVFKNGEVPGSPDPEPGPGDIVTPPTDPGTDPGTNPGTNPPTTVDPTDPTGVYRIMYYQNNGALNKNGVAVGELTTNHVTNGVSAASATKEIFIQDNSGTLIPLTAASLNDAKAVVGTHRIVYKFTSTINGSVTFYTVFLLVHGDMTVTVNNPIDTTKDAVVPTSAYTGANATVAQYINYDGITPINVNITAPNASDFNTTVIKSYNVVFKAAYPYKVKDISRLLRVHGAVMFTANAIDIRTGAAMPISDVKATIQLAPVAAGSAMAARTVTDIIAGAHGGSLTTVGSFTQPYNGKYVLGTEYGVGQGFAITGVADRKVTVNGMPEITANTITVGTAYTKDMFLNGTANASGNSLVNLSASVHYAVAGMQTINKGNITITSNLADVKFGIEGTYDVIFSVSDNGVTGKPGTLAAEIVTKTIKVIIDDTLAGSNKPVMSGNKDINWLQGKLIVDSDIKGHVSAQSFDGRTLTVNYVIKDNNNTPVTSLAQVVANPAKFTIEYFAIDPMNGTRVDKTNELNVYGEIKFTNNQLERDFAVGSDSSALNYNDAKATYKDVDGSAKTIFYSTTPEHFEVSGDTVDFNTVGRYKQYLTVKHPAFPANTSKIEVDVRIHGVPTVTARANVRVNNQEAPVELLTDTRFNVNVPSYTYFARENGVIVAKTANPVAVASGTHVNTNKLIVSGITPVPNNTSVTFEASQDNPLLNPSSLTARADVAVEVYKNGGGTTDPGTDPGGVVTPPDPPNPPGPTDPPIVDPGIDPETVDPTDPAKPNGVNRILYYMNNGVIRANGNRSPALTVNDILAGVNQTGATSKVVKIADASNTLQPLSDATLGEAITAPRQRRVVYEFKTDLGGGNYTLTYFTAYLRVNSDITKIAANAIDGGQNKVLDLDAYGNANNMTATFVDYLTTTQAINVVPPTAGSLDMSTVQSYNITYTAQYPYVDKQMTRLLRVHGPIEFTTAQADIRVGAASAPLTGVTATVKLAPIVAGTISVNKTVSNITVFGATGNLNVPGNFTQQYQGTYPLGTEYGTSPSFTITDQTQRTIVVHGMPTITANDMFVGLGYDGTMLGNPLTNPEIGLNAFVQYGHLGSPTNLISKVQEVSSNVNWGTPGEYKIKVKVTDNVAELPAGLAAETATHEITITISDGVSGNAPSMAGNRDIDWVEGKTLTVNDILGHVSGYDNNANRVLSPTYTLTKGGLPATITEATSGHGIYTITYTIRDSKGNNEVRTNTLNMYGAVKLGNVDSFPTQAYEGNARPDSDMRDIVTASYINPDGTPVNMDPWNYFSNFSFTGDYIDTKTIGIYNSAIEVTHPIFENDNSDSKSFEYLIHGSIVLAGTGNIDGKRYIAGKDFISSREGVTATYMHARNGLTNLPIITNMDYLTTPVASTLILGYHVADPLNLGGEVNACIGVKFDAYTLPSLNPSAFTFNRNTNIAVVKNKFKIVPGCIYYAENPTYKFNFVSTKLDYSAVKTSEAGTYPIYVNIVAQNGVAIDSFVIGYVTIN